MLNTPSVTTITRSNFPVFSSNLIAKAECERRSNELKNQTLTPLLIQQEMIAKWDGKLPVYGQIPELFRTITK